MLVHEDIDDQIEAVREELKIQRCLLQFAQRCPTLQYAIWDAKGGTTGFEQCVRRLEAQLERLQRLQNA